MREIQVYFDRLGALSPTEIDQSARDFVAKEKKNVACLIAHLSELDRRKIHLDLGYKSLFEYATRRLCLGEGTVYLRIQVARVCRRFPQVLQYLGANRMTLSVAGLLAPHLCEENVEQLLSACEGKTKREVDEYLVLIRETETLTPSVRKRASSGRVEAAQPDVYNFRFSAGKIFKEKLERLSEVLGIEDTGRIAEVLEEAVDIALDRKDPKRRQERRERRADSKSTHEREASRSRHVPAAVRDRVFQRADYQCEFRGQDGHRCSQRSGLEVDHDPPWATGTDHDETHLRALCRRHNHYSAEQFFGAEFIAKRIRERRERSTTSSGRGRGNPNRPVLS